jgi:predicted amidohydrolase YtcJ
VGIAPSHESFLSATSYEENIKGSIEARKLADLMALGRDPFKENPCNIISIPIERTIPGGKSVFES